MDVMRERAGCGRNIRLAAMDGAGTDLSNGGFAQEDKLHAAAGFGGGGVCHALCCWTWCVL